VPHRNRAETGTRVNFIRLGATAAPVQPALRSQSHLPEIDGLRGIACLLVVLLHCLLGFVIFPALTPARNVIGMFLAGGVDTFFVLSGFLIVGILIDNRGASNYFRVFWARRVLRIFPVYFLLYATFLIMLGVKSATNAPALNVWLFKDSLPVWSYPLFIQNYFMAVEQQTGSLLGRDYLVARDRGTILFDHAASCLRAEAQSGVLFGAGLHSHRFFLARCFWQ
jgi:Acyltransferase family